MAGERNGVVKLGPGQLGHVAGVNEDQKVLAFPADIRDGGHNDAVVLLTARLGHEGGLGWVTELGAPPGLGLARLHVDLGDGVGKVAPVDRLEPTHDVGVAVGPPAVLAVDAGVLASRLAADQVRLEDDDVLAFPLCGHGGHGGVLALDQVLSQREVHRRTVDDQRQRETHHAGFVLDVETVLAQLGQVHLVQDVRRVVADDVDDDVALAVLEAVDKVEEEESVDADVLGLDDLAGGLVDQVEGVLGLGVPFQAVLEGVAFELAGDELEAVGHPRLLDHDQVVAGEAEGVVVGEAGGHPGGEGGHDLSARQRISRVLGELDKVVLESGEKRAAQVVGVAGKRVEEWTSAEDVDDGRHVHLVTGLQRLAVDGTQDGRLGGRHQRPVLPAVQEDGAGVVVRHLGRHDAGHQLGKDALVRIGRASHRPVLRADQLARGQRLEIAVRLEKPLGHVDLVVADVDPKRGQDRHAVEPVVDRLLLPVPDADRAVVNHSEVSGQPFRQMADDGGAAVAFRGVFEQVRVQLSHD